MLLLLLLSMKLSTGVSMLTPAAGRGTEDRGESWGEP